MENLRTDKLAGAERVITDQHCVLLFVCLLL